MSDPDVWAVKPVSDADAHRMAAAHTLGQQAQQRTTDPFLDIGWRRLSPRMLFIHPVREVGRALPALFGVFVAGSGSGQGHWWSLSVLVVVITLSIVRWATTRFQITEDQVQLKSGLFRRKILTTPADRVRTVDVTEHALHRMLGLAKVSIGTGTSDKKKEGLVLDGLDATEARALRGELLHHRGPNTPENIGQSTETKPVSYAHEDELLRLNRAWIRYAPFTLSGAITGLAILGIAYNAAAQSHVDAGRLGAVRSTSRHLQNLPLWLSIIEVSLVVGVIVVALSIVGYLLSFWNFRLTRHSEGTLQVTRGLITTRSTSIENLRLRGVEISEPILLRAVRGARAVALATGLRVGRGAERGGSILAPPAPRIVVGRVAEMVLAQRGSGTTTAEAVAGPLVKHGHRARRRRLNRAVVPSVLVTIALAILTATADLPIWLPIVALVLTGVAAVLGLDRYASLGHAVTEGLLVTRYGSLIRRRVMLETDGIIGWNQRRSFFQRRAGLVTLIATTAAGAQHYRIVDISPVESLAVARQATPGLLEQFLGPLSTTAAPTLLPVLATNPATTE